MHYTSKGFGVSARLLVKRAIEATENRILIAGGAGFLGSRICDVYIAQNSKVICLDNLSTGRMQNIAHLLDHPNFEFVQHDVIDPFTTSKNINLIYNMACPASPPRYQADPIQTFRTNVHGAENLLELAQAKGARILQASTSEVYGDPEISPQHEGYYGNANTMGPRSCYDEGKRAAETLFHDYNDRRNVDIRVARIFNTYGPRMDPEDGRVVSNFVTQALKGEAITIYGDGTQTRSFCYVDDLVRGLYMLMHSAQPIHRPVNLGNPDEFTMVQLADIVTNEVQTTSVIKFEDLPVDDPRQRRPDISEAKARLNWHPKIDLRSGLKLTIPYYIAELLKNGPQAVAAV
jgi:UDP-glucuronate decarboxylase